METIIDDLIKSNKNTEDVIIKINGRNIKGNVISKPLNHNFNLLQKLIFAIKIIQGKAIAIQYFSDLSTKQKEQYINHKLK